ncbi:MAG: TRAP transporter small permease subunit [Clostridia bacterium]|nr:TRAP transporter small permease subunit [Clostridia bacterium]
MDSKPVERRGIVGALNKIADFLDTVCGALAVVLIAAMLIITAMQIIFRTFFTALIWSEQATRFMLIWATFIGTTCVYRRSGNIAITAVQDLFPPVIRKFLRVLVHVLCLVLFIAITYYGFRYVGKQTRKADSIPIKMKYVYVIIPISMIVCAYHAFVLMINEILRPAHAKEAVK